MGWIRQTYRLFSGPEPVEGSQSRFWSLAQGHSIFLYNMALRYTGNTHDAEDLLQDTLYMGFKRFQSLRDPDKIRAWLLRIMRNRHIRLSRKNKRSVAAQFNESVDYADVLEQFHTQPNVADLVEQKLETEKLLLLVSKMPEKYQTPLLLFYMEDMSYQEISELIEIPMGTVMSRLSRAKSRLKAALVKRDSTKKSKQTIIRFHQSRTG